MPIINDKRGRGKGGESVTGYEGCTECLECAGLWVVAKQVRLTKVFAADRVDLLATRAFSVDASCNHAQPQW